MWVQNPNPGPDTVGIFRPSQGTFYLRFSNTQGNADSQFPYGNPNMAAVAGRFGDLPGGDPAPPGIETTTTTTTTPPAFTFGSGTWRVGIDIPADTYRNSNSAGGCYWERLSGFSGELADILANSFDYVRQIVTVKPTDAGFASNGCGTWSDDLSPIKTPTAPLTGGTWIVGSEVAPGSWRNAPSDTGCYWERTSGFSGESADIIANDFIGDASPQIVTINAGDAGFYTDTACGTWTFLGP